jgi:hypothetical protein
MPRRPTKLRPSLRKNPSQRRSVRSPLERESAPLLAPGNIVDDFISSRQCDHSKFEEGLRRSEMADVVGEFPVKVYEAAALDRAGLRQMISWMLPSVQLQSQSFQF